MLWEEGSEVQQPWIEPHNWEALRAYSINTCTLFKNRKKYSIYREIFLGPRGRDYKRRSKKAKHGKHFQKKRKIKKRKSHESLAKYLVCACWEKYIILFFFKWSFISLPELYWINENYLRSIKNLNKNQQNASMHHEDWRQSSAK